MKSRRAAVAAMFSAWAIFGIILEIVVVPLLLIPWSLIGCRAPVAQRLIDGGYGWLAGPWSIAWVKTPEYLAALATGVAVARVSPAWGIPLASVCGGGMVAANSALPWLIGMNSDMSIQLLPWDMAVLPLIIGGAVMGQRVGPNKPLERPGMNLGGDRELGGSGRSAPRR